MWYVFISYFYFYKDEPQMLDFFLLQVTRCLVEVLSKALTKPDSQLDTECKDILLAGLEQISSQFSEMLFFKKQY